METIAVGDLYQDQITDCCAEVVHIDYDKKRVSYKFFSPDRLDTVTDSIVLFCMSFKQVSKEDVIKWKLKT